MRIVLPDVPVTPTVPSDYALYFLPAQSILQSPPLQRQRVSQSAIISRIRFLIVPPGRKPFGYLRPGLARGDAEDFAASVRNSGKEFNMLYYALMFLVVGLIAGALNLAGVAAVATQISWILFLIGIVLLVIHLVTGRTVRDS